VWEGERGEGERGEGERGGDLDPGKSLNSRVSFMIKELPNFGIVVFAQEFHGLT
jgi:hypothetical protein